MMHPRVEMTNQCFFLSLTLDRKRKEAYATTSGTFKTVPPPPTKEKWKKERRKEGSVFKSVATAKRQGNNEPIQI